MSDVVIGVDLGGTRLRAGRLDTQLKFLERTEMLTKAEEGLEATLGRIKEIMESVLLGQDTRNLGAAAKHCVRVRKLPPGPGE